MNYTSDSRFDGLYLGDSFHLEFRQTGDSISLGFLYHLEKGHPHWSEPIEGEWACYKKGWMTFSPVSAVALSPSNFRPSIDADGELDFGSVDSITITDNGFLIITGWGTIELVADNVKIEIEA